MEALRKNQQIGTIDKPRDYFEGRIPMKWGLYQDHGRPEAEPPLVYFGGRTEQTIVGLGGSSRHTVGFHGASATGSRSVTPYLVAHLLDGLGIDQRGWCTHRKHDDQYDVFEAIVLANQYLKGITTELIFTAKTLMVGAARNYATNEKYMMPCILGSPLFVEMAHFDMPDNSSPF